MGSPQALQLGAGWMAPINSFVAEHVEAGPTGPLDLGRRPYTAVYTFPPARAKSVIDTHHHLVPGMSPTQYNTVSQEFMARGPRKATMLRHRHHLVEMPDHFKKGTAWSKFPPGTRSIENYMHALQERKRRFVALKVISLKDTLTANSQPQPQP